MSDDNKRYYIFGFPTLSLAVGIFWYAWGIYGFWWGLAYGLFWPTWVGYRLAAYLLGHA